MSKIKKGRIAHVRDICAQALARILAADVDESLSRAVVAVDSHLKDQHAKLASLSDWRRDVER